MTAPPRGFVLDPPPRAQARPPALPQTPTVGAPVFTAQPDPMRQAADQRAAEAAERAARAEQRAVENQGLSQGYRWTDETRTAQEPIPGGAAAGGGRQGRAMRQGDADKLETQINAYMYLKDSIANFQDDFAGNAWTGELENWAQSRFGTGTPGQRDWWANFRTADNSIRNALFGASLTEGEKAAYESTTVSPSMTPEQVRENLTRRVEVARDILSRRVGRLYSVYNKEEVEAALGDFLEELLPEAGGASQGADRQAERPPPLSGAASETGGSPPRLGQAPFVNAGGQLAGNVHDAGDNPAMEIARGGTRQEDNPALAGVRAEYLRRLGRGDTAESIIAWANEVGIDPSVHHSIISQVAYRRANPRIALGEYDTSELDDRVVGLSDRASNAARAVDTPAGAFVTSAGDAFTGFNLDSLAGAGGGNAEQARLGMEEISRRHPVASTVGTVAGGTAAALGLEGALATKGIAAGLPRAIAADSAFGTVAGAGATDYGPEGQPATFVDRLIGAGKGGVAGAAGSYGGYKAGGGLARIGRGVSDPAVAALRNEGVDRLTVGQVYGNSGRIGRVVKGVEDRLAGLPVVGDMINARRAEGLRQFNARAFDKALEPIGGTVGDVVGEEAVELAQQQVSEAFTAALRGRGAVPDQAFADELVDAVDRVRSIKRLGDEVTDQIGEILQPYADEAMLSGEALDDISRNLRALRNAYAADPLAIPVARRVDVVEKAIFDLFDRQAAGTIPAYKAARQAYRRLSVIEDAVLKGKNTEGSFTPAQLGQADRTNSVRFDGKRTAARGGSVFHDYQRAAQNVLPNRVPDSGTAGRVLVPLALVSGGGGVDAATGGSGVPLTLGTILAGLYTRRGQRALTRPARGMKPGTGRRAAMESPTTRRLLGVTGAAGSAAALTDQR